MGVMQCHLLQLGIIYVNHAMPSYLASHRICELYCAIFFSIMYSICQQCLHIHLLFLCISHFLLVTDSSSEEDSEREMTSRIPPEVHALTWLGYIAHIMHMVSCIAMPSAQIRHALCECLLFAFYIRYVNYAMPCFSASYHICELCTAMEPGIIYVNYLMPSFFSLRIPFVDNLCILNYSSCVSAI